MSVNAEADTTRVLIVCDEATVPRDFADRSWSTVPIRSHGEEGELNLRADSLGTRFIGHLDERANDMVRIAAYAFAADQLISRGGKGDPNRRRWRRELAVCVPVSDPSFWADEDTTTALVEALGYGTEDHWEFAFSPSVIGDRRLQLGFDVDARNVLADPDCVALLSGGIDSLCATVEAVADHQRRPVLVSHRTTPPVASHQQRLIAGLETQFPAWSFPRLSFWIHKRGKEAVERTRRTRGFLVAALGAAVAGQVRLPTVLLPDNGYVSLNPPVNAQLVGTLNSRGTHPTFLRLVNRLLDLVFPDGVQLENPLERRTRTEALAILSNHGCEHLLRETRSCSHSRFTVDKPHCGVCSQCVDRRFATVAAGLEAFDPPEQYEIDLFTAPLRDGEARVFATSYVGHAYRVDTLNTEKMFSEYPELEACLDLDGGSIANSAESLAGVLKRHADEVLRTMESMVSRYGNDIARGRLPATSLLRMAVGSVATGPVSNAETNAARASEIGAGERPPGGADQPEKPRLQRVGQGWWVTFASERALIHDSAGMTRLVRLLKAPGQQFSALDLVAGSSPSTKSDKHRVARDGSSDGGMNAAGDLGEMTDEVARQEYRQRARELEEDWANAKASGDEERYEQIRAELEAIQHVLKATTGKRGKRRTFSAEHERARQTVSKTIKTALDIIEEELPTLRLHLHDSLVFGHFLTYDPRPRLVWDISP